ncbi:hypothetical protein CDIK_2907 [Cucumispora dikerogammari]|nr:hypothetical protein CDIK_2907 [Cucumispora dikerogammari]
MGKGKGRGNWKEERGRGKGKGSKSYIKIKKRHKKQSIFVYTNYGLISSFYSLNSLFYNSNCHKHYLIKKYLLGFTDYDKAASHHIVQYYYYICVIHLTRLRCNTLCRVK